MNPDQRLATVPGAQVITFPAPMRIADFLSIESWMTREIPKADRLLGDLVTSNTKMFLVGSTGLGKTQLAMALACGMASGEGFLHWIAARPARVLYMDGEMAAELVQQRGKDAVGRLIGRSARGNLFIFARDTEEQFAKDYPALPRSAPLNTPEGKDFLLALIDALEGVDVVVFDNVMSLISGDQKDEVPWTETFPLIESLTARNIAQIWADHTGHERSRQYGSATKAWRFDSVGIMSALPDSERSPQELAFQLSFESPAGKARRRTPDNWRDFETTVIRLNDDTWTSDSAKGSRPAIKLSPQAAAFLDALDNALNASATPGRTTKAAWITEAIRLGECEPAPPHEDGAARDRRLKTFRTHLSTIRQKGIIGVNGEEITDLRKH